MIGGQHIKVLYICILGTGTQTEPIVPNGTSRPPIHPLKYVLLPPLAVCGALVSLAEGWAEWTGVA